jgi:hypothetical protein
VTCFLSLAEFWSLSAGRTSGSGNEGNDDVCGVPVEVLPSSLIDRGRTRVGAASDERRVTSDELNIAQRHAGTECGQEERSFTPFTDRNGAHARQRHQIRAQRCPGRHHVDEFVFAEAEKRVDDLVLVRCAHPTSRTLSVGFAAADGVHVRVAAVWARVSWSAGSRRACPAARRRHPRWCRRC